MPDTQSTSGGLNFGKYLEGFMDVFTPYEAQALEMPKVGEFIKKGREGALKEAGAAMTAKKLKPGALEGHHTMPLAEGAKGNLLEGDPLAWNRFNWHLQNLPEVSAEPGKYIKDVPKQVHEAIHKPKKGMVPPAEHLKSLSTEEQASLWNALQGRVQSIEEQSPTISQHLKEMVYTPEYRRQVLHSLATTPERKELYKNAGEQAARVSDEIAAANPKAKVYLGGSYASDKPNPRDIDMFVEYPSVRSWFENKGLNVPAEEKGPSKVHVSTTPPRDKLSSDPWELFKNVAKSKYGDKYDWIRLASILGIPTSTILSSIPIEENKK